MNNYQGLLFVIPTRNRHDLARNAIRSILNPSQADDIQIVVSDNSTENEQASQLRLFCGQMNDPRLHYIQPPYSMSMATHWDWALDKAMEISGVNHFLFLGDRVVFKPGAIDEIVQIARKYPSRIISYFWDEIYDLQTPVRVTRNEWSGKVFEVDSSHQLYLSSQCFLTKSLPKMLNTVAPRSFLRRMQAQFGNVFASISPDYCFAFRCLATEKAFLYYDKTLLVGYSLDRSNGLAFTRGRGNISSLDFESSLGKGISLNYLTPIPEITVSCNGIIHEYYFVKNETQNPQMPDVNFQKYLYFLAKDVQTIEDEILRKKMLEILRAKGWRKSGFFIGRDGRFRNILTLLNPRTISTLFGNLLNPPRYFSTFAEALHYTFTFPNQNTQSMYLKTLNQRLGPIVDGPE